MGGWAHWARWAHWAVLEPEMTVRAPVRDQGIYQKYKDNDKLPQEQADKRFTRCFSWFADEAFPLPFVLDWYKSSTREYLADPRDIIFITHIVFSFLVVIPSTILLLVRFSWLHAAIHAVMMTQTIPPFILMLHCVCHKKAGTKKGWWIDFTIHNILCPVYGTYF